jgi:hypothetical protein
MKFKGFNGKLAKNLGYRESIQGDVYLDGTPVHQNYTVIVKKNDCRHYENEFGQKFYDPEGVSAIKDMTGHSRTNLIYGAWKKRKVNEITGNTVEMDDGRRTFITTGEYFQCTVYFVLKGQVYRASMKRMDTPKMRALYEIQEIEHEQKSCMEFDKKMDIHLKHDSIDKKTHQERVSTWKENMRKRAAV